MAKLTPLEHHRRKLRHFFWDLYVLEQTRNLIDLASQMLEEDDLIIDIGANFGSFTQGLINRKKVRAICFEPVEEYYRICLQKFSGNKSIKVENLALSDFKGQSEIWLDSNNLGWNTMIYSKTDKKMVKNIVNSITFDEYATINKLCKVKLVKIDVEGAEFKTLRGMRNFILSAHIKPVIFLEIAWGKSHPFREKEVEEFEFLFANGYQRINYDYESTQDVIFFPTN